jgi:hypothetical protein
MLSHIWIPKKVLDQLGVEVGSNSDEPQLAEYIVASKSENADNSSLLSPSSTQLGTPNSANPDVRTTGACEADDRPIDSMADQSRTQDLPPTHNSNRETSETSSNAGFDDSDDDIFSNVPVLFIPTYHHLIGCNSYMSPISHRSLIQLGPQLMW